MNNPIVRSARFAGSRRGGPARRPGFTLIELLTVITIIALMLSVMMAAIFQIMAWAKSVPNRVFISRLSVACQSYCKDYEGQPPAVANDPTSTGFTPASISGTQSLRLALIGYSIDPGNTGTVTAQSQGTCNLYSTDGTGSVTYAAGGMTTANYQAGIHKTYELKLGTAEMQPPSQLLYVSGGDPNIDVFVDRNFSPIRPILYYAMHSDGIFHPGDNSCYTSGPGDNAGGFTAYQNAAIAAKVKFFLVWCGPDRAFFTGDDFASVGN